MSGAPSSKQNGCGIPFLFSSLSLYVFPSLPLLPFLFIFSLTLSFPLSLLSPSSPSFNPNLKRIPQHVHLVKLALQSNSHAQQLLGLGCRGVVVAEQSGCGLTETSAERVGESAVSCMSLQEPGDEGRGQLRVKVAGFNWNTH